MWHRAWKMWGNHPEGQQWGSHWVKDACHHLQVSQATGRIMVGVTHTGQV